MKVKLEKTVEETLSKDREIAHLKEEMGKLKQESVANRDGWKEAHEKLKSLNTELDNIRQANNVVKSELDLANAKVATANAELEKVPSQIQQAVAEFKKSQEFVGEMDVVMTAALMIGYTRAVDLAMSLKLDLEADKIDSNYYDPDAETAYEQFMTEFQEGVSLRAKYRGAPLPEEDSTANASSEATITNPAPTS